MICPTCNRFGHYTEGKYLCLLCNTLLDTKPKCVTDDPKSRLTQINDGGNNMPEMLNLVVGDAGKKSLSVGTAWYEPNPSGRRPKMSGYVCLETLREALKNKTVSTQKGDQKSRNFAGKDVFRIAAFPIIRGASSGVAESSEEL